MSCEKPEIKTPTEMCTDIHHICSLAASVQYVTHCNQLLKKQTFNYEIPIRYLHCHSNGQQEEEILFRTSNNSQKRKGRSSGSQNRQCQFTDLQLWLLKRSCQKPCGFNIMFAFSSGQFQAPCDTANRRKGRKSISMPDCVFQGRNYDIFMREISSFVKNVIGHPTYTQPESFMTHKLIKSNEYTEEIKYSSQWLQGICSIKFKLEKKN